MSEQEKPVDDTEALVDSYMDNPDGEAPTDEDRKTYYGARYRAIKEEYKALLLNKEELEARKDEQALSNIRKAFTVNYKARKAVVIALRTLGEKVEDKAVPLSAI